MQFETWGALGLFVSAFISATIAPGGSEAVLAYLVNQKFAAPMQLIAIASIGNTLGALTTLWMGIWTARKYPADTLAGANQQRSLQWIRAWGSWALLFSWLPVIGDGLCFAAGWLRMAFVPCLFAIALGKLLRYAVVAYAFV